MTQNKRILVFRFSALGDVAMTIPVLWSFSRHYSDYEIWFVSRPFAKDLVEPIPNIRFFPIDLKDRHNGLRGLFRLFRELKKSGGFEAVVDLHGVLRTHILTLLFRLSGVKTAQINKGRKEKEALTRKNNKIFKPLPSTVSRYQATFQKAGFVFEMVSFPGKKLYDSEQLISNNASDNRTKEIAALFTGSEKDLTIGIAPFARHQWKMWPLDKMWDLISRLDNGNNQIILFGGRGEEQNKLEEWAAQLKKGTTFAGQLSLGEELRLMAKLDVMISMDSANMHLASLAGTRVVSIWGATHPYAGFYGIGQELEDAVQTDLECRPCSVFGNKPCHRGDFACMMRITPQLILKKVTNKIVSPQ
ncbi:glycosyltransferase family 9 protein [Thermophagus sp. OGC60D27]|uniref:glycosyltransferase family 9 protein n=1 Tax=Thermophagus sp. OGC60D27 TaxID=3458415 RepID=UPI0040381004